MVSSDGGESLFTIYVEMFCSGTHVPRLQHDAAPYYYKITLKNIAYRSTEGI